MESLFEFLTRTHWRELEPGERVMYRGSIVKAHGVWVVHAELGDDRYTLSHPLHTWERLNADRIDVEPIRQDAA